jgi:hypothetical protein
MAAVAAGAIISDRGDADIFQLDWNGTDSAAVNGSRKLISWRRRAVVSIQLPSTAASCCGLIPLIRSESRGPQIQLISSVVG